MSPDQQHCTHSCRGRCQALQSSSSAPLFESPARLSRREGGAGHSINFALRVAEIRATLPPGTPVEIWFQDEMRVGQKNKLTYRWPEKARVPGPSTINAPNQPTCSARYAPSAEPALPSCCPLATPRPCSSISTKSQRKSPPAHTPVLILDQAGWLGAKDLKAPKNISLLPLPPRAPVGIRYGSSNSTHRSARRWSFE